ncbi:glycosyltransferase family 2 protein [Lysinimonas soli]|uniref:Glycosyltransferase family 2 protein n=1 Tax=Lysinimonas soli TaxID=1074233 RepID=A0ABW0NTG2_9MICO
MTAVAPVVSVALASYNGGRFIAEQLASILAQTRRPDEVVVSDGGSTDDTVRVARGVLERDGEGVRWQILADGSRLNVRENFQRAIAATHGDLIALSDQDDVWRPDRLSRTVTRFDEPGVMLASSDARLIDAAGVAMPLTLFGALGVGARELEQLGSRHAFALLIRRNLVTGATVMFRRELLRAAEPFPQDWVHDEWLAIVAAAVGRLAVDPQPLIDYRQHGENTIGVTAPTLRYRVQRMVESRGTRYQVLAARSVELSARLDQLGAPLVWRALARRKASFENVRAGYDPRRFRRILPALRELRSGSYQRLSSQGSLDIARDLVQRP